MGKGHEHAYSEHDSIRDHRAGMRVLRAASKLIHEFQYPVKGRRPIETWIIAAVLLQRVMRLLHEVYGPGRALELVVDAMNENRAGGPQVALRYEPTSPPPPADPTITVH